MPNFTFTLMLTQPSVDFETASNRLFEAGCDDGTFGVTAGVYEIDFDREAETFHSAITTAVDDVEKAQIGSRVTRVMPDDLVNASGIAERAGKTRQAVSLWRKGQRGEGFPQPVSRIGDSPVWSWAEVAEWLGFEEAYVDAARFVARLNRLLENEIVIVEVQPKKDPQVVPAGATMSRLLEAVKDDSAKLKLEVRGEPVPSR